MPATKPFPWKCGHCRSRSVRPASIEYTADFEHDGREYALKIPGLSVLRCENCGEVLLDDDANRRISEEMREHLGLLSPSQIRRNRETLGMTQRELASLLGIAEATISRWETGAQIQQRALDRLMRLCFASREVRLLLANDEELSKRSNVTDDPPPDSPSEAETELTSVLREAWANAVDAIWQRSHLTPAQAAWVVRDSNLFVRFMEPLLSWSASADAETLNSFSGRFRDATTHLWKWVNDRKVHPEGISRWFVAPLQAKNERDSERAAQLARVAMVLDELPDDKANAAFSRLAGFLEVFVDEGQFQESDKD
jgi:putative zinc finger/helix-turn-helix YgiT family protein